MKMLYYLLVGGYSTYKMYEYWEIVRFLYLTGSYTYSTVNGIYRIIKPKYMLEEKLEDWELCNLPEK